MKQFSSTNWGPDSLYIPPKVANFCSGCWVRIAVKGASSSQYTITVHSTSATILLTDGAAFPARVTKGGRAIFFKYIVPLTHSNVTISLTAFSPGPLNLYVSGTVYRPDGANTAVALAAHNDTYVTPMSIDESVATVTFQSERSGVYYISVQAPDARVSPKPVQVSFSIKTRARYDAVQVLEPGSPQGDVLAAGTWSYYAVAVPAGSSDVTISATMANPTGLVYLFANDCGDARLDVCAGERANATDGTTKDRRIYDAGTGGDWKTATWNTCDQGFIRWKSDGKMHPTTQCTSTSSMARSPVLRMKSRIHLTDSLYIISVYAPPKTQYSYAVSRYTISAVSNKGVLTLLDSVAVVSAVSRDSFQYFRFHMGDTGLDTHVVLTPFAGDADLYGSTSVTGPKEPTQRNHTFSSSFYGEDQIIVRVTDKNGCVNCDLILGVYGYAPAQFSIMVRMGSSKEVPLLSGQPQRSVLAAAKDEAYFTVVLSSPTDSFSLAVAAEYGDVDLYVKIGSVKGTSPPFVAKGWGKFDVKSLAQASNPTITIHGSNEIWKQCPSKGDPKTFPQWTIADDGNGHYACRVHILAVAKSATTFSLTSISDGGAVMLRSGVYLSAVANPGTLDWFTVTSHSEEESVRIR